MLEQQQQQQLLLPPLLWDGARQVPVAVDSLGPDVLGALMQQGGALLLPAHLRPAHPRGPAGGEADVGLFAPPLVALPLGQRAVIQVGVIDMLQAFTLGKQAEGLLKSVEYAFSHGSASPDISAVEPAAYARRFIEFAHRILLPLEP